MSLSASRPRFHPPALSRSMRAMCDSSLQIRTITASAQYLSLIHVRPSLQGRVIQGRAFFSSTARVQSRVSTPPKVSPSMQVATFMSPIAPTTASGASRPLGTRRRSQARGPILLSSMVQHWQARLITPLHLSLTQTPPRTCTLQIRPSVVSVSSTCRRCKCTRLQVGVPRVSMLWGQTQASLPHGALRSTRRVECCT